MRLEIIKQRKSYSIVDERISEISRNICSCKENDTWSYGISIYLYTDIFLWGFRNAIRTVENVLFGARPSSTYTTFKTFAPQDLFPWIWSAARSRNFHPRDDASLSAKLTRFWLALVRLRDFTKCCRSANDVGRNSVLNCYRCCVIGGVRPLCRFAWLAYDVDRVKVAGDFG